MLVEKRIKECNVCKICKRSCKTMNDQTNNPLEMEKLNDSKSRLSLKINEK